MCELQHGVAWEHARMCSNVLRKVENIEHGSGRGTAHFHVLRLVHARHNSTQDTIRLSLLQCILQSHSTMGSRPDEC